MASSLETPGRNPASGKMPAYTMGCAGRKPGNGSPVFSPPDGKANIFFSPWQWHRTGCASKTAWARLALAQKAQPLARGRLPSLQLGAYAWWHCFCYLKTPQIAPHALPHVGVTQPTDSSLRGMTILSSAARSLWDSTGFDCGTKGSKPSGSTLYHSKMFLLIQIISLKCLKPHVSGCYWATCVDIWLPFQSHFHRKETCWRLACGCWTNGLSQNPAAGWNIPKLVSPLALWEDIYSYLLLLRVLSGKLHFSLVHCGIKASVFPL